MGFDLDAYFERIGYSGERVPTLATLAAIHVRHTEAIAFENLNPLIGWPIRLDMESLQQKMVRDGRGSYCYEHNLLLKHALDALCFRVTGLWRAFSGAHPRVQLRHAAICFCASTLMGSRISSTRVSGASPLLDHCAS